MPSSSRICADNRAPGAVLRPANDADCIKTAAVALRDTNLNLPRWLAKCLAKRGLLRAANDYIIELPGKQMRPKELCYFLPTLTPEKRAAVLAKLPTSKLKRVLPKLL